MKRKPVLPRNPYVAAAKFKKAGAHGKSEKALRRAATVQTHREYGVMAAQHPFKVPGPDSSSGAPTSSTTKANLHWAGALLLYCSPVAQLVERSAVNRKRVGSRPARGAIN